MLRLGLGYARNCLTGICQKLKCQRDRPLDFFRVLDADMCVYMLERGYARTRLQETIVAFSYLRGERICDLDVYEPQPRSVPSRAPLGDCPGVFPRPNMYGLGVDLTPGPY